MYYPLKFKIECLKNAKQIEENFCSLFGYRMLNLNKLKSFKIHCSQFKTIYGARVAVSKREV